jgi:hypothetical protein
VPITVADAETITSYEAGIKADLFNRRARASLSVYNYDVKNQQLTVVGGNSNVTKLINAAKTTGRGLEADFEGFVTPDFKVTAGGSYNFTEIKDPSLYVAKCGSCTVTDPLNAAARGYRRQPAAASAEVHLERYRALQLAAGSGNLFVLTDWSYRNKINFFLYESKEFTGKEWWKAACAWVTTGPAASMKWLLRPQHHQHRAHHRRHRLQQPDRLRQRATSVWRAVPRRFLRNRPQPRQLKNGRI